MSRPEDASPPSRAEDAGGVGDPVAPTEADLWGAGVGEHPRTGARLAVQLVLGGAAAVTLVSLLWPFLPALVTAGVFALILLPLQRWLLRKLGRSDVAAALTTLIGILGLVVPLFVLGALLLRELAEAADWMAREGPAALRSLPLLERAVDRWFEGVGLEGLALGEAVAARVREAPRFLTGRAFGLLAGVGGLVLQAGVAIFTLFFVLRDGERLEGVLRALIPLDAHHTTALLYRSRDVVAAAVYGNLFVAVTQGTLGGLAFWALDLPTAALWGALMGIASLVPMVGPGVVWVPAGILLLLTGSLIRGIVLLAFGALVISTVDNVIRSVLVGSRARIHPLGIFLGVLGGILMFGAVGIFVGPVVLVVSLLLLEMVRLTLFPPPRASLAADAATARPSTGAGGSPPAS